MKTGMENREREIKPGQRGERFSEQNKANEPAQMHLGGGWEQAQGGGGLQQLCNLPI